MASLRILIAEDDKLSATLLKVLLEAEGHDVCAVASSGGSAIEAARRLVPDAVLMDIYLSDDMSGVEAARIIVQDLAIPTMFITGTTDRVLLEQVVESGALGLIKKPISADELRINLRILLHHQQMTHRLREKAVRYGGFFHDAPVGMYVCDAGGVVNDCNYALATLLGYGSVQRLMTAVSCTDALYVAAEHRSMLLRCIANDSMPSTGRPATLRRSDDTTLDVLEFCTCEKDMVRGGVQYQSVFVPLIQDSPSVVSELEVLRGTLDAIPDPVIIMGLDRSILAANKAFFNFVGNPADACFDSSLFPFVHGDASCSGVCPFSQFRVDYREHSGWVHLTPDGPALYNTVSPLRGADGTLLGCVQTFRLPPPGI